MLRMSANAAGPSFPDIQMGPSTAVTITYCSGLPIAWAISFDMAARISGCRACGIGTLVWMLSSGIGIPPVDGYSVT